MADDDDDLNDFKLPPHSNEAADAQLDSKALKLVEEYVASLNRSKNENDTRSEIRTNIVKLGIHSLAFQHELTAQKMMDAADRREYMAGRKRMGRVLADKQDTLFPEDLERIKRRKEKAKEKAAKEAAKSATKTAEDIERGDPKRGGAGGAKGRGRAKDAPAKPVEAKVTGHRGRKPAAQAAADRAEDRAEQAGRLRAAQDLSHGSSPGTLAGTVAAGNAGIAEAAAKLNAELEQKTGGDILDTAIASMKDNGLTGKVGGGLGSVSDEVPLSQSEQARQKLEEAKLA